MTMMTMRMMQKVATRKSLARWIGAIGGAGVLMTATLGQAVSVGFTESFETGPAGWEDSINNPVTAVTSGGVDGGGYVSTNFNYFGFTSPFGGDGGPVTFRASFSDNPSGGAFVGDYLTEGVGAIRVAFRHNAPEPITLFMRVATQFNFPGAVIDQLVSAPSDEWTTITFAIDPFSPLCTGESISCAAAFSNVENLQFGTNAPAGLVLDDFAYTLDLDRVEILPIPEPGTALLFGLGLAGLASVRRSIGRDGALR